MGLRLTRRRLITICVAALLLTGAAIGGWYALGEWRARRELAAARAELARYHYESAYEHIRPAVTWWPERGEVQLEAARLCRRAERPDEARPYLEAARRLLGDTEEVRLERHLTLVQKGEATEAAENALAARAGRDGEHRELIREALLCGALTTFRVERAKAVADAWLKDAGGDPRPWYWRGTAEEVIGGYAEDAAVADYRKAVELDPEYDEARARLARLLLKGKNAAGARPHFEELLRRRPDDAAAMVGLARCLVAGGEAETARGLLDRALTRDPDNAEGLRERGMMALNESRPEEAEPLLRRSYELQPQDPYTGYNFMICLKKLGREAQATEQEARNTKLKERQSRLLQLLGEFQQRPRDAAVTHEIGTLYLGVGGPDSEQTGLWWMQKTLEIDPAHAATLKVLAEYFEHKDMRELAERFRQRLRRS